MQFKAFENNIEVNGRTIHSIVDGFKNFKSLSTKYLKEQNIGVIGSDNYIKIDLDSWYPQQSWLKAFENISRDVGASVLFLIGQAIPKNAEFPPSVRNIEEAIQSINIAYHLNHRKNGKIMFDTTSNIFADGIGYYGFKRIEGQNMIVSECRNPYPCDFDRGIIDALATKFELKATVIHDNSKPCRKNGADSCTYIISW